jgi:hypothetical protein
MKDIHPSLPTINKKKKMYVRSQYYKIKGLIKLDDHMVQCLMSRTNEVLLATFLDDCFYSCLPKRKVQMRRKSSPFR